jgi:hypothetical protein
MGLMLKDLQKWNLLMPATCAGDQGKYREMQDKLFENSRALGALNLNMKTIQGMSRWRTYTSFMATIEERFPQRNIRGFCAGLNAPHRK